MTVKPFLTTERAAAIFKEMIECRRMHCADTEFFLVSDVWDSLCDEQGNWLIIAYHSDETVDFKPKAGVVAMGDLARMTVDQRLLDSARDGSKLSNFILAHEIGHLALNHHAQQKVTKNFQLFSDSTGMKANIPPTLEELEANYAAVFFQCGVALLDSNWDVVQLADRARSDRYYVRKARRVVQLEVFQEALRKISTKHPRVIF